MVQIFISRKEDIMVRPASCWIFFTLFVLNPPANAGTTDINSLFQAVQGEISGNRARDYVMRLWLHDKWSTLPEWQKANREAQTIMEERGFDEALLLGTPADGITKSCGWTNPIGWDVKQATLEVIDPVLPDEFRYLCNYLDNPTSLNTWSAPTPPEGIETELVLMEGADPAELGKLNASGKIVLTKVYTRGIKRYLDQNGILGYVSDNIETPNVDFTTANQWLNGWSDMPGGWWMTGYDSKKNFCFSISQKRANYLRDLLRQGKKVKVRAKIDSRYYTDSQLPYVTGVVKGSGPEGEEVLITGHLDEWGANDNSSGCSAILESVGTLNDLIKTGMISRPKRSIRVLMGGEMYGSLPYVEKNLGRMHDKTVAAVCCDTPVEDYDSSTTAIGIAMNPNVCPTYADAVFPEIVRLYYAKYNKDRLWYTMPYSMGTDTYFCEPMIGAPTNWIFMSAGGGHLHHNSMDTIEKVDPRSLRELSFLNAVYLYTIANAGIDEVPWFAGLTFERGVKVIAEKCGLAETKIRNAKDGAELGKALADGIEIMEYYTNQQKRAVESIERLVPADKKSTARAILARHVQSLDESGQSMIKSLKSLADTRSRTESIAMIMPFRQVSAREKEASAIIPKRHIPGTLFLEEIPFTEWKEITGSPHWWAATNWASASYWWVDGARSLAEIKRLCELEAGQPMTGFDLINYYTFLNDHKYVEFVPPPKEEKGKKGKK
jgi:hypothetical protein